MDFSVFFSKKYIYVHRSIIRYEKLENVKLILKDKPIFRKITKEYEKATK